jgi:hypothetical protein
MVVKITLLMLTTCLSFSSACCGETPSAASVKQSEIGQLLSRVPKGSSWQVLDPALRTVLETRALEVLEKDRQAWGLLGLQQKLNLLLQAPTPLMIENIDRILGDTFASELTHGFRMERDVQNEELKRQLLRIYLTIADARGYMLSNHPDYKGWDGRPVRELQIIDHEHFKTMSLWNRQTEDSLRAIADGDLTKLEIALRNKSYFTTRANKHFDRPAVGISGAPLYSSLYERYPFLNDSDLLDAYNASSFTEFREVNVGTLRAFMYDYDAEFNEEWLKKQKIPDGLVGDILKLGTLYRTRTMGLPGKDVRCTIYSPSERDANWDAATADLISNADGSETMQSYAKAYDAIAAQRQAQMQRVGQKTLERLFPDDSPLLSKDQRARVSGILLSEKRPAMMINTLISALDSVTGATAASAKVKDALAKQPKVGGGYVPGDPVRASDRAQIVDMWNKARAFVKHEYSGYRVDISALIPDEPILVTTGQNQFTVGGKVNLSLEVESPLPRLSSTILHEMKHAIDQNSHAPVEGAAWEGAATSIERQVWPSFIEEAMAGQGDILPMAILDTEFYNVRFTATTDATLKIFLRESCDKDEPDTIAYAEEVVRGYGYDDTATLDLRSQRAHRSTQYIQYDYGLQMYADLLSYLQNGVGPKPRVDAYLIQACGLSNPKKDNATVDDLKVCIRDRKS